MDAGDRVPHGKVKPLEGTYPSTYWCSHAVKGVGFDLEERLSLELVGLEPHSDFLARLHIDGGRSSISSGGRPAQNTVLSSVLTSTSDRGSWISLTLGN